MINVGFEGNRLFVNGNEFDLENPINDAFYERGLIVVLLDPDANMESDSQYKNLLAYDLMGNKKWEAELPTNKKSDVYWRVNNKYPLVVSSFSSFECEIDLESGTVKNKNFYK